uniref:Uncharacterized protein n=1 Tax=Rhizophora mucronata TaxID=61149 RepID=A0A2P2PVZ6_RHIMU
MISQNQAELLRKPMKWDFSWVMRRLPMNVGIGKIILLDIPHKSRAFCLSHSTGRDDDTKFYIFMLGVGISYLSSCSIVQNSRCFGSVLFGIKDATKCM